MFLGSHSFEPSKFITVHVIPEKDDFLVCPTPAPHKISSFTTLMQAWNIYLAILIDYALTHASQLDGVSKNDNISKQPVPTNSLVELWHVFAPLQHQIHCYNGMWGLLICG